MTVEECIKKYDIKDPVIVMADTGLEIDDKRSSINFYGQHSVKEVNGNTISIYSFIGKYYRVKDAIYAPDIMRYENGLACDSDYGNRNYFYSKKYDNLDTAIEACENAWNKLSLPEKKRRVFFGIIAYGEWASSTYDIQYVSEDEIYIIKDTR